MLDETNIKQTLIKCTGIILFHSISFNKSVAETKECTDDSVMHGITLEIQYTG